MDGFLETSWSIIFMSPFNKQVFKVYNFHQNPIFAKVPTICLHADGCIFMFEAKSAHLKWLLMSDEFLFTAAPL